MSDKLTKLAMSTLGIKDSSKPVKGGTHEDRQAYFDELSGREAKDLSPEEAAWLAKARQAMDVYGDDVNEKKLTNAYLQNVRSADRVLPRKQSDAFMDGQLDGMYPKAAAAKKADETSGRDKLDEMAVKEFSTPAKDIGKKSEGVRVSVPEAMLFDSLNRVPQGEVKDTAHYMGRLAGGKFVDGMTQGYAKADLHPTPTVKTMMNGEEIAPQHVEHDEHGNIIIHLPTDMPSMKAPVREDKSINPSGYNKKTIKI